MRLGRGACATCSHTTSPSARSFWHNASVCCYISTISTAHAQSLVHGHFAPFSFAEHHLHQRCNSGRTNGTHRAAQIRCHESGPVNQRSTPHSRSTSQSSACCPSVWQRASSFARKRGERAAGSLVPVIAEVSYAICYEIQDDRREPTGILDLGLLPSFGGGE